MYGTTRFIGQLSTTMNGIQSTEKDRNKMILTHMTSAEIVETPFYKLAANTNAKTSWSFMYNSPNPIWTPQNKSGKFCHNIPLFYVTPVFCI